MAVELMNLAFQPTLTGMAVQLANCSRFSVGSAGEMTARLLFEQAGYAVRLAGRCNGDLTVIDRETGESWSVEVKTARRSKDQKWRFTLIKAGHTNHGYADRVLLLAVLKSGRCVPFLVPVEALSTQRQAVITSHPESYAGKLAQYRKVGALTL